MVCTHWRSLSASLRSKVAKKGMKEVLLQGSERSGEASVCCLLPDIYVCIGKRTHSTHYSIWWNLPYVLHQ